MQYAHPQPDPRAPVAPRNPRIEQNLPMEHAFYRYYAGYSSEFVKDAIAWLDLPARGATVLDPWNGSGTTTSTVYEQHHQAIGFDANPAMVVVARARIASSQACSIRALAYEIASLTAGNPASEHPY